MRKNECNISVCLFEKTLKCDAHLRITRYTGYLVCTTFFLYFLIDVL